MHVRSGRALQFDLGCRAGKQNTLHRMETRHWITALSLILLSTPSLGQDWQLDLAQAQEQAASKDRLVVLVFQGSDWCAPCIKLDREVWSTEEFQEIAKDDFVMVKADFPRHSKNQLSAEQAGKNKALAERFNREGAFPMVVVMGTDGKVLGRLGYDGSSPKEYARKILALKK